MDIKEFINQANSGGSGFKDKIFGNLVKHLFSERNIFMLARLKRTDFADILRMVIMSDFYSSYYEKCTCTYEIIKTKTYPYYKVDVNENAPTKTKVMSASLDKLLKKILKLTVSEGGKGREEAVKIAQGVREALEQDDRLKSMAGVN